MMWIQVIVVIKFLIYVDFGKEIIEEMQKLKRVRGVDCMSLKRIKLMLFSAIILVCWILFLYTDTSNQEC